MVEQQPRLIAREDEDASSCISTVLEGEGVAVRTHAQCIAFAPHAQGVAVRVECREGAPDVVASHVLLALGRQPNTGVWARSRPASPPTRAATSW